jgi:Zn-dependent protease with chaperone function/uncharacterized tellurite resistance protein B-like protein
MRYLTGLVKVLLILLVIPAIGYGVSLYILNDLNKAIEIKGFPDVVAFCNSAQTGPAGITISNFKGACEQVLKADLLGLVSTIAAMIGIFIPVMYWLASLISGKGRKRIAALFSNVLKFAVLLIALSILLQGAVLTFAVYIAELYFISRIHLLVIVAIGLCAFLGSLRLIFASIRFGGKLQITVTGKVLDRINEPRIFEFVNSLAEKLEAKKPDHIIIGLEPNIYVTGADIYVPGHSGKLKGQTLFISAPLSRLLSEDEFTCVVGHELGHFIGEDTIYNLRFAPSYAGLGKAIGALRFEDEQGTGSLAEIPAILVLSYLFVIFASNVEKISRDREHRADLSGVEAGSGIALATALLKTSLYSSLWNQAREQNIERLDQGKTTDNLSLVFQDTAKYDIEEEKIDEIMQVTLQRSIYHPTDSHLPLSVRLDKLKVKPEDISKNILLVPDYPAVKLIDNYEEVEKEITILEHGLMVAYGLADPPEEELEQNELLHATYSLAAAMVVADGQVFPEEIAVAEDIGYELFDDFDSIDFREYCNNPSRITDVEKLSVEMGDLLEEDQKVSVISYLQAISEADGIIQDDEKELMEKIKEGMGLQTD